MYHFYFSIDINECVEGLSICSQVCTNTVGSYTCSCHPGYTLSADNSICSLNGMPYNYSRIPFTLEQFLHTADCGSACDEGTCIAMAGEYRCICPLGQMCTGDCGSADLIVLQNGRQTCEGLCAKAYLLLVYRLFTLYADCIGQQYGYECSETCSCMNGGSCNNTIGCVCASGWTGSNCAIGKLYFA